MHTSLSLPSEVAEKVEQIVKPYGGSIPGFARELMMRFVSMSADDREEINALIDHKLKRRAATSPSERSTARDIGEVPAIPNR